MLYRMGVHVDVYVDGVSPHRLRYAFLPFRALPQLTLVAKKYGARDWIHPHQTHCDKARAGMAMLCTVYVTSPVTDS